MRSKLFAGLALAVVLTACGAAWAFAISDKSETTGAASQPNDKVEAGCCATGDCCCPGQGSCCDSSKRLTGDAVQNLKKAASCCSTGNCCCPGAGVCCAANEAPSSCPPSEKKPSCCAK